VVAYIGTLGYAHGLDCIIKAAQDIRKSYSDIKFLLVGEGADKERLKRTVQCMNLDNIVFVNQQPREKIPSFINVSDVCTVLLKKEALFSTVIPTKMLEFMACERPVILGVDGVARKILESGKAGEYIEPENDKMLAEAVIKLYNNRPLRIQYGVNGRNFVIKHYARADKAKEYMELLEKVVS
jgi:glycosyltransferase involved in cell wall biosynthesis